MNDDELARLNHIYLVVSKPGSPPPGDLIMAINYWVSELVSDNKFLRSQLAAAEMAGDALEIQRDELRKELESEKIAHDIAKKNIAEYGEMISRLLGIIKSIRLESNTSSDIGSRALYYRLLNIFKKADEALKMNAPKEVK